MSANVKAVAAIVMAAMFLSANAASAQHRTGGHASVRHLPRALERA